MFGRWNFGQSVRQVQTRVNPDCGLNAQGSRAVDCLRLLSFNIQVGINTRHYGHYLTRSWQHLLPHSGRIQNLQRIGELLHQYDLVALQEVDGGSLRSGHINQVEHLARLGHFPYWYQQLNRNLAPLAQHSNGVLSRFQPECLEDHSLPGVPGRGAILLRFGHPTQALVVVMMHLALGARERNRQLAYIRDLIAPYPQRILMGDMNTHAKDLLEHSPLKELNWQPPSILATFPSWRPKRNLDHILLSPGLVLKQAEVLPHPISDHLPVAVEIGLPESLTAYSPC
ncbi:endonuclease/exonuclease/phosphatase family metal-dependent hydrolase [Azomonas agilis]|uniref:Endonuclease/exonuclease/phosphatase family metal-dependent hydrolase n=1 Tax=Azomonas agilis TaxID=116849 RepID=A0A562IKC8_9GAMM|nr:endonuclease/exonuclease/phosphatase family protein [Azomonas agilis]TWH71332.1 endonuclease/exonuclease/phosphatase family metal-dependent hydrolase [Azomonas agilis]